VEKRWRPDCRWPVEIQNLDYRINFLSPNLLNRIGALFLG